MSERNERLASFVEKILGHLDVRATMEWTEKEGQEILDIRGEDMSLLLAHGAKVLYAIEYLANLVCGEKQDWRVLLDCNDFRAMRSYELELVAKKAAEKVKTSLRPFPLQPMPPSERRIVHMALVEDPMVRTESQGFGDNRRVVIIPNKLN
ncbi:MAG: hypothetical protein HY644_15505 [Acidobacteria bacterium]|nr:hypothetical protein [Acidobacteriota bacterium]